MNLKQEDGSKKCVEEPAYKAFFHLCQVCLKGVYYINSFLCMCVSLQVLKHSEAEKKKHAQQNILG